MILSLYPSSHLGVYSANPVIVPSFQAFWKTSLGSSFLFVVYFIDSSGSAGLLYFKLGFHVRKKMELIWNQNS